MRIPVSELEKVVVTRDDEATSPQERPDERGFVRWDVTLDPRARRTIRLAYEVKRHKDVVGI
jgi:hypothetical protein